MVAGNIRANVTFLVSLHMGSYQHFTVTVVAVYPVLKVCSNVKKSSFWFEHGHIFH